MAMDDLTEQMMQQYNREQIWIYHTVQMYRHDRLAYLEKIIQRAEEQSFKIGVKLVRGAYIEKENARAQKMNYPSPMCATKQHTDDNFMLPFG